MSTSNATDTKKMNELMQNMQDMPNKPELEKMLKDTQGQFEETFNNMKETYESLKDTIIKGSSEDETVTITITATYEFVEIDFSEPALKGGVREFKWRIREAWKNVMEKAGATTQEKTMDLLKNMDMPPELQAMMDKAKKGENDK